MFQEENNNNRSFEETRNMPIFKKAEDILSLTRRIVDVVSKEDSNAKDDYDRSMLDNYADYLMDNAAIIPAKIAGAEGANLYDIRMENAAIIRKAAREIITDCSGLTMSGFREEDYLNLLKNEIEQFRLLFAKWVQGFNKDNYMIDRWGLFNPPGVNYDDHDPDDDIPFDPDDFFNEL